MARGRDVMSKEAGFEVVESFTDDVKELLDLFPKEVKRFMQREGRKQKIVTEEKARTLTKEQTGEFRRGISVGRYYKYEGKIPSIRVYGKARHSSPLEFGHGFPNRRGTTKDTNYDVDGEYEVKGKFVFKKAGEEFQQTYDLDIEKFSDKLLAKLD